MKPKKAIKKLTRAEQLLSDVIDRYTSHDHVVHGHLDTALASVTTAKQSLDDGRAPRTGKKSASSAKRTNGAAKRKPNGQENGRPLTKTA